MVEGIIHFEGGMTCGKKKVFPTRASFLRGAFGEIGGEYSVEDVEEILLRFRPPRFCDEATLSGLPEGAYYPTNEARGACPCWYVEW